VYAAAGFAAWRDYWRDGKIKRRKKRKRVLTRGEGFGILTELSARESESTPEAQENFEKEGKSA